MAELIFKKETLTLSTACDDPLTRAVIISLFSWGRANPEDEIFDEHRQGWWGDFYNESGRKTGSRLWELLRNKVTENTMAQAKEFCEESLAWLVEDSIAREVTVKVERGELDRIDVLVKLIKPDDKTLSIRFQDVWSYLK